MSSTVATDGIGAEVIGYTDADLGALHAIADEFGLIDARVARDEVARVRVLARAGQLARKQASGSSARVRAHDMALRAIAAELAARARVSDRSMQRQIDDAVELVEHYPAMLAAREAAQVTRQHLAIVRDAGAALPPEMRAEFDVRALERCLLDSPNRVRAQIEILAQRMHPRSVEERHREARDTRAVRHSPLSEGMSEVCAIVPTVIAVGIDDRLTQMAQVVVDERSATPVGTSAEAPGPVDTRTMDQLRADLFAQLLLAGSPIIDPTAGDGPGVLGTIRAKVQVVIPALSLAGRGAGPADLVGHSPIDPDTARELAAGTGWWERLVTHPVSGSVLAADGYQRPASLDRWLRARDQHCRFPGCRTSAVRCEVDHTVDYARGGATEHTNLAHLCQRHHSMKQFTAWGVRQLEGGVLEWTSPTGRVYVDSPPHVSVHFTPDGRGDPPPPASPPSLSAPPF